ncbi:hypothetical protein AB0M92_10480 [Streptomyces sp. NPDC051582]|uniref:hypothetical protein n=1 Tax=Streptomyces sp. NPDC051582 TaxID=3155167 RepID=UPI0034196E6B
MTGSAQVSDGSISDGADAEFVDATNLFVSGGGLAGIERLARSGVGDPITEEMKASAIGVVKLFGGIG